MRLTAVLLALFALLSPAMAQAADTARTDNFTVIAPSGDEAEAVAAQAESFRKQAALEWFGREFPTGKKRTIVDVTLSTDRDEGLCWPIDSPDQTFHRIWITTSQDHAVGSTLHHEVVHTVLHSFIDSKSLPPWLDEGIASQVDDPQRQQSREQLAASWASESRWPQLQSLFTATRIEHSDAEGYTTAASVARYLASLGGKRKLIEFAQAGCQTNWDQAAHDCYGVRDVAELQAGWQNWVRNGAGRDDRRAAAVSSRNSTRVN